MHLPRYTGSDYNVEASPYALEEVLPPMQDGDEVRENSDIKPRAVIFTDVDGTLLNDRFKIDVARDILDRTFDSCSIVMVSSRTVAELLALQESLGLYGECIAENGGVVASYTPLPSVPEDAWDWEIGGPGLLAVQRLAAPVGETIEIVRRAAAEFNVSLTLHRNFSPEELARKAGYSLEEAERSFDRRVSVLLDPSVANSPNAIPFLQSLRDLGCSVGFGGNWISVVKGADKGTAVLAYLAALRARGEEVGLTVGIGNESNDAPLLRAVDRPYAIRNPRSGHARDLLAIPGVNPLSREGCAGWEEMAEEILNHIQAVGQ